MINSNPETVSTDFDISDKLYFEPLTLEDVLEIVEREKPLGVIVQLGGQTPLKLTRGLEAAGVRILGTSPDAIDTAEDRRRFDQIARELGVTQPPNGTATSVAEAIAVAEQIGYPVLVRPSYVLGGRAMEIVYDAAVARGLLRARGTRIGRPSRTDRQFPRGRVTRPTSMRLPMASSVVIGGIMQHIEDAGIHSGDSACVLPPYLIGEKDLRHDARAHRRLREGAWRGWLDQRAVRGQGRTCVRARGESARSRTVPFVSKAIGVSLAALAARVMLGEKLDDIGIHRGDHPALHLGEGSGVSVHEVP